MNFKANLKYILTGSVVFLLIYMVVAAVPMGPDVYFQPVWTSDISTAPAKIESPDAAKSAEAFILGDRFGYFSPDGKILASTQTTERVTASPDAWATYPEDAHNTVVYRPDGTVKMTIAESGFVHLDYDRTYLFLPGGDGVSQYGDNGKAIWTREHTAPVTAFNSSKAGTIIGYADGLLSFIRPDGSTGFSFYPGGSNYQVILGAAVSEDGTMAACVSGIDRQRFILIKIESAQSKIVFHTWLEGNLRRQAFVGFEKKGSYAFFESEGSLGIVDCKRFSARRIPVQGKVISAGECASKTLFMVLVKNGENYTLSAVERPDHLVASVNFSARNAFLVQREDAIYLGTDNRISRINIRGLK